MGGNSGGGGGGTNTVTRTELDPVMRPFVQYGLEESARLYQNPTTPQYYPGQTYVSPSQQTQAALAAAQQRAVTGNPLTPAAQQQSLNTIQGNYLSGNPFFEGAFKSATQGAQTTYQDTVNAALSNASRAGRYGSGSMGTALDRAGGIYANALTNTAGNLAYQNYDAERARQQAMIGAAPQLANADYTDINQLLQTGQAAEGYQETAMADAINRYNFAQQAPYQKLQSYLSGAYGAPSGMQVTQPVYRNQVGNILGGALAGAALGGGTGLGAGVGAGIGAGIGLLG
jgi:hypothetical protein